MSALNIEELTQQERVDALGKLLRLHVGAVKLDGPDDDWCVVFNEKVAPRATIAIAVTPYLRFAPRKLIITEPVREIMEHERIYVRRPVFIEKKVTWYGRETIKTTDNEQLERTIEHRSEAVQKRGIWIVQTAFVGQRLQFPSQGGIGGDSFGPDSELFSTVCEPGMHVTLVAENTSDYSAHFLAVLIGKAGDKDFKKGPEAA